LGTGAEYPVDELVHDKIESSDQGSETCFGKLFYTEGIDCTPYVLPKCCCNFKACKVGSFESVFSVMKESILPPHIVDVDWIKIENFTGTGFVKD